MMCPACGADNPQGADFCAKCKRNLNLLREASIEKVDLGGYHSEDEYSSSDSGFKIGTGTFTINERQTAGNNDFFSSGGNNKEFEQNSFEEPFIPKLDAGRVSLPSAPDSRRHGAMSLMGNMPDDMNGGLPPVRSLNGMPSMRNTMQDSGMNNMQSAGNIQNNDMNGLPPVRSLNGMPNSMNDSRQNFGMGGMRNPDMGNMRNSDSGGNERQMNKNNGTQYTPPMYGNQQMMYQPQLIGYDRNGMPIYSQPPQVMYQPQFIGYDQNGMPMYSQPPQMMYQPQFLGYDQNGMPVYGQPAQQPRQSVQSQQFQSRQQNRPQQDMPRSDMVQPEMLQPEKNKRSDSASAYNRYQTSKDSANRPVVEKDKEDFWEFFDGGKSKHKEKQPSADDFFGKQHGGDMGDVSASNLDISRLKKHERKKNSYMSDTPLVDADKLAKNESSKFNKFFMRQTDVVNANDLEEKKQTRNQDIMGVTADVDISALSVNERYKSRIKMSGAGEANPDDLETFVREHKTALMAEADHAVEALPKKKPAYIDELDAIELPEYMQAKKTVKNDTPEIPSLPEL